MRKITKIFKALSDSNRLRIIKMLEIRPLCVCEITDILQLANSTVSKHLSILRDADLILDEKDGKWVNYRLNESATDELINQLMPILKNHFPDDNILVEDALKVRSSNRNTICGI
jgi:ArsR family transcriptional regulator